MPTQDAALIQLMRSADVIEGGSYDVAKHFDGENAPKLPDGGMLEYGEIALNIAKGYEAIAIKNDEGEIVYIPFNVAVRLLDAEDDIVELSGFTEDMISELSAATVELVSQLREDTENVIESLSSETFESISALSESMTSLIDGTNDRIESLSADTAESIYDLYCSINSLSAYTDDRFDNFGIDDLSDVEISDEPDKYASGFMEFIGNDGSGWRNFEMDVPTVDVITDDELVTAAAIARLNHSLGFNVNGEYVSYHSEFVGYNVTNAIDMLYSEYEELDNIIRGEGNVNGAREITYETLLSYKNNGTLVTGTTYRIVNYQATVRQTAHESGVTYATTRTVVVPSVFDTSMGFDILVEAVSNTRLDEHVHFMRSKNKSYFIDCDMDAWCGMYCIDNDTDRFRWADPNGFGVIYYMKDEFGNEAGYDFKNIVFRNDNWGPRRRFTFNNSTLDGHRDLSMSGMAIGNVIHDTYFTGIGRSARVLGNITFSGASVVGNTVAFNASDITLEGDFNGCSIASSMNGTTVYGPRTCELIGYTTNQL